LLDRWLGTGYLLVLTGILGGMALSLYLVWFRYGTERERSGQPPDSTPKS
jgi:ATP synthase protein I